MAPLPLARVARPIAAARSRRILQLPRRSAGILAILVGCAAIVLLILGKTDLVVAGYVVALVALVIAALPLFRDWSPERRRRG
jgi:hypothetical protein